MASSVNGPKATGVKLRPVPLMLCGCY